MINFYLLNKFVLFFPFLIVTFMRVDQNFEFPILFIIILYNLYRNIYINLFIIY